MNTKEAKYMGHHHKHHKHHHSKIHCKYHPTDRNMDKILFPNSPHNRPQGVVGFCEGLRAFPIGKRHCK